jgi:excisionase family DNA binding protein
MSEPIIKLLLRPKEVGETLGVSRTRVYQMLATREIESIRIGRSIRVPVDAVETWISEKRSSDGGDQ